MDDLRELQLEELKLLKIMIKYCDENNLMYYLLGGTLLGAIRHKGFIPWDDDVDVCLPRDDYKKLLHILEKELTDPYYLVTYQNTADYRYPWARIISKDMKIINRSANIPREEYAWIDLIPLDGYPNPGLKRKLFQLKLSFWWNLNNTVQFDELVDQKRERSWKGKLGLKVANYLKHINKVISYKTTLKHLDKAVQTYEYNSDTVDVINFLCAYGFKEVFPRKDLQEGLFVSFEGENMRAPKDYKDVLKRIYGDDYMELPPENERNKHNSEVIYKKI